MKAFENTYEKILVGKHKLSNVMEQEQPEVHYDPMVYPITILRKGIRIETTGGTIGKITGHRTDKAIQIKKDNGEIDWISKEARVKDISNASIKS